MIAINYSIGSLAKNLDEEGVQNVTVKSVVFNRTQNGLRIKSWGRPSKGFVRGVVFENVIMVEVNNPIIIDQNYCPRNENCPGQVIYHMDYYIYITNAPVLIESMAYINLKMHYTLAEFWSEDKRREVQECEGVVGVGSGGEVRLQQDQPLHWDCPA